MKVHPLYSLRIKAQQPMESWDFSRPDGRMESGPLPRDYWQIVQERLRPDMRLLDMGTGGGEFLPGLGHPYHLTAVTEGYAPNLALCRERLCPLGIKFKAAGFEILAQEQVFPFLRSFDIAALVCFARIIEWEFPGFSVDARHDQLVRLQEELERTGRVEGREHRFLIAARKKHRKSNQMNTQEVSQ